MELLGQKVQLPTHGAALPQERPELREMGTEAGELLGHVAPRGPRRHLLREASRVRRHLPQDRLDPLPLAGPGPPRRRPEQPPGGPGPSAAGGPPGNPTAGPPP